MQQASLSQWGLESTATPPRRAEVWDEVRARQAGPRQLTGRAGMWRSETDLPRLQLCQALAPGHPKPGQI